jgi:hypothetical protein
MPYNTNFGEFHELETWSDGDRQTGLPQIRRFCL